MPNPAQGAEELVAAIRHLRARSEAQAAKLYWNERRIARSTRRLSALLNRLRRLQLRVYRPGRT